MHWPFSASMEIITLIRFQHEALKLADYVDIRIKKRDIRLRRLPMNKLCLAAIK